MSQKSTLPLPQAGQRFTANRSGGPAYYNLYKSLQNATLRGSDYLHPIKEYIGDIAAVFDNPIVKRKIRYGGLDRSMRKLMQRSIIKKIAGKDPTAAKNRMIQDRVSSIIRHYSSEGRDNEQAGVTAAKVARYRASLPEDFNLSTAGGGFAAGRQAGTRGISAQTAAQHVGAKISASQTGIRRAIGTADWQKKNIPPRTGISTTRPMRPIIPLIK